MLASNVLLVDQGIKCSQAKYYFVNSQENHCYETDVQHL